MEDMYNYRPRISPPRTEFILNENLFVSERLLETCRESKRRICILADSAIATTSAERLRLHLNAEIIPIEGGESCKTRATKQKIEDELLKQKFGRDSLFIGMGGGSVTDLVGFIAATYMRGVPLILIPTTLLGMVDAAIGGKNGINTAFGKNLLGTIYHPIVIGIDTQLLQTLPEKEWFNGLAEILKHGLIYDPQIWQLCEKNPLAWQSPQILNQLIRYSLVVKMHISEEDPEENGMRRILNFGHTVGHGLELLSKFKMTHGEAVAIGSMAESWLSAHLGYLSQKTLEKILDLYKKCGFSMQLPKEFSREALREAMQSDKKSAHGKPRYVIIERIGRTIAFEGAFCTSIEDKDFDAMVDWMETNSV